MRVKLDPIFNLSFITNEEKSIIIQKIVTSSIGDIKNRKKFIDMGWFGLSIELILIYIKWSLVALFFIPVVFTVILILWNPKIKKESLLLLFGISSTQLRNISDDDLVNFVHDSRFNFDTSNRILCETRTILKSKSNNSKLIKTRDINIYLVSQFDLISRFICLWYSFKSVIKYARLILLLPEVTICIKELVFELPVSKVAIKRNLISAIATTNSAYLKQDPIFHLVTPEIVLRSVMFWYSDNSVPKDTKAPTNYAFDDTLFDDMRVKEHFVWGESHGDYLSKHSKGQISIVGSQLFYPRKKNYYHKKDFDLLIFDVTPFKYSKEFDFYNVPRVSKFIEDIFSVLSEGFELKLNVGIKHKREINLKFHSPEYVDNIQMLKHDSFSITWVKSDTNLYDLISKTRLVIGIPFTSPVYVAKEMGVPSFYYLDDTTVDLPASYNGIGVIRDKNELKSIFQEHFFRATNENTHDR
jgi:polysaccharide biosynthesis PFTS motif protein